MNQYSFNTQKYLQCYNTILSHLIYNMNHTTILSSLSMTFINQIIPLYSATIQISKNLLLYTTHISLQNVACNIINTHTKDIQEMIKLYNYCTCENTQKDISSYLGAYERITSTMFSNMKTDSNNIDISYINEMIPLLYSSIEIAKNLLQYPINKDLSSILNTLILTQEQDIKHLKSIQHKLHSTNN